MVFSKLGEVSNSQEEVCAGLIFSIEVIEEWRVLPSCYQAFSEACVCLLTPTKDQLMDRSNLSGHGQLAHFAQIGRQLGYAGYFATDQMLWLAGVGVTRPTKESASFFIPRHIQY
jgi:hypothetical protein